MENSIEEDMVRIEKLITTKFNNDYSIDNKDKEAIEHILSDYKRVLKENKELKNDYENLSNSVVVKNHYIKNSIPIQKSKRLDRRIRRKWLLELFRRKRFRNNNRNFKKNY